MTIATPPPPPAPPAGPPKRRIGDMFVEAGLLTPDQIELAVQRQKQTGRPFGEVLLDAGLVDEIGLAGVLSSQFDLPLQDLRSVSFDQGALLAVPEELARERLFVPTAIDDGHITVAMAFPNDRVTLDAIKQRTNREVIAGLALRSEVLLAIQQQYKLVGENVGDLSRTFIAERKPSTAFIAPALTNIAEDAPVVQLVNLLFAQALRDRASDIHIEPQQEKVRVRYRIDGVLHEATTLPKEVGPAISSRIKIMANLNIVEKRRSQDGQLSISAEGRDVDVRVNTIETIWGEKLVLRILDKSLAYLDLTQVGLDLSMLERHRSLVRQPFGMILVCGPTGSGKTTTLYATMNDIDRTKKNITTIEDPVEYVIDGINQVAINNAVDRTFANGLRALLRQDPDVILVGEIRDRETAEIASNAALTGHLVISSIHANDAIGGLFRLMDLGVERFMITSSLLSIISQRLVRKIDPHCRIEVPASPAENVLLKSVGVSTDTVFTGQGCNYCSGTGFLGRTGIFELLVMSEDLKLTLNQGGSSQQLRKQAEDEGMVTLRQDGLRKVARGLTTVAEVLSVLQTA
jgi:type IV pilus assembly protein PilB